MGSLLNSPRTFRLFQAIRLIELIEKRDPSDQKKTSQIGLGGLPSREMIRLGTIAKSRFAGTEIEDIEASDITRRRQSPWRYRILTSTLGLTGSVGALPRNYTALLLERLKKHDHAMADFFDLFNHRSLSLFYRSWAKHRLELGYESSKTRNNGVDPVTGLLNSLVGQGLPQTQNRNPYHDNTLISFSGLFSSTRRSASGLETILQGLLGTTATVSQFQPHWLNLELSECTRLGTGGHHRPANNQLGVTAICGERVFDMQSQFRIGISAPSFRRFASLLPGQQQFQIICDVTRRYVGMEFDFEVQVELKGEHVPQIRLDKNADVRPQLGRNCWLTSVPMKETVRDAVFRVGEGA